MNWQQDPQSNWLARIVFPERVDQLSFEVDLIAELAVQNPFDFFLEPAAERFPFEYEPWLERELRPFREILPAGSRVERRVAAVDRTPRRTVDFLVDLNRELAAEIQYLIRMEPGVQTADETLERGSGSCRDSTWLLVQILRRLGLAARFVSGYLIQLQPDDVNHALLTYPALQAADIAIYKATLVPVGRESPYPNSAQNRARSGWRIYQ